MIDFHFLFCNSDAKLIELNLILNYRWWKDLSAYIGLDYVRDRVIKCYFYSYSVCHEQEHARARMILSKIFVLWTLLDDTFDTRATLEECQKLHQAIQRLILDLVNFHVGDKRCKYMNLKV